MVFTLSWWLGLCLLARDPRQPVLALAAVGLCGFALVVALDAVRLVSVAHAELLSQIEIYLVAVPGPPEAFAVAKLLERSFYYNNRFFKIEFAFHWYNAFPIDYSKKGSGTGPVSSLYGVQCNR